MHSNTTKAALLALAGLLFAVYVIAAHSIAADVARKAPAHEHTLR